MKHMLEFIQLCRNSWLGGIPLHKILNTCVNEQARILALHTYGQLEMMALVTRHKQNERNERERKEGK